MFRLDTCKGSTCLVLMSHFSQLSVNHDLYLYTLFIFTRNTFWTVVSTQQLLCFIVPYLNSVTSVVHNIFFGLSQFNWGYHSLP